MSTELSTTDVCEQIGVTFRQVDRWCSHGLLGDKNVRPGTGIPRRFGHEDVISVRVLRDLARLGCSMPTLRAAIDVIRSNPSFVDGEYLMVAPNGSWSRRLTGVALSDVTEACWIIPLDTSEVTNET